MAIIEGRDRVCIESLLLVGMLARLAVSLATGAILWPDSLEYYREAQAILHTGSIGVHELFHTPLYPLFLSAFLKFGSTPSVGACIIFAQRILGLGSIVLLYSIAIKLFDRRVAFLSALILAVHPLELYYESVIQTEILFLFVFLLLIWTAIHFLQNPSNIRALLTGLASAVAVLTRPVAYYMPLLLIIPIILRTKNLGRAATLSFILLFSYSLSLVPWMVVNKRTYYFFGVSRGQGLNLFLTAVEIYKLPSPEGNEFARPRRLLERLSDNNVRNDPLSKREAYFYLFNRIAGRSAIGHLIADRTMYLYALASIREHPTIFASGVLNALFDYYFLSLDSISFCVDADVPYLCSEHSNAKNLEPFPPPPTPGHLRLKRIIFRIFLQESFKVTIVGVLAISGVFAIFLRRRIPIDQQVFLVLVVLYLGVTTVVFNVPNDRYRLPVDPILFIWASFNLTLLSGLVFDSRIDRS